MQKNEDHRQYCDEITNEKLNFLKLCTALYSNERHLNDLSTTPRLYMAKQCFFNFVKLFRNLVIL